MFFSACWESASKVTDEVAGTYAFEYPRGDYQRLRIYKDSSFVQELYMNKKSFKNKVPPFYVNNGRWSIEGKYELRFNHWLEYCYLRDPDSILLHPARVSMSDVYWNKSTRDHNGYITIFDETGYYFDKVLEDESLNKEE